MHQLYEGIAASLLQDIPDIAKTLKRTLEILGGKQPGKWGDSVITESQNRLTQRGKKSIFP